MPPTNAPSTTRGIRICHRMACSWVDRPDSTCSPGTALSSSSPTLRTVSPAAPIMTPAPSASTSVPTATVNSTTRRRRPGGAADASGSAASVRAVAPGDVASDVVTQDSSVSRRRRGGSGLTRRRAEGLHQVHHARAPAAGHVLVEHVDLVVLHRGELRPSGPLRDALRRDIATLPVGQHDHVRVAAHDVLRGQLGIPRIVAVVSTVTDAFHADHGIELADEALPGHAVERRVQLVVIGQRLLALGHLGEHLVDVALHGRDHLGRLADVPGGGAHPFDLRVRLVEIGCRRQQESRHGSPVQAGHQIPEVVLGDHQVGLVLQHRLDVGVVAGQVRDRHLVGVVRLLVNGDHLIARADCPEHLGGRRAQRHDRLRARFDAHLAAAVDGTGEHLDRELLVRPGWLCCAGVVASRAVSTTARGEQERHGQGCDHTTRRAKAASRTGRVKGGAKHSHPPCLRRTKAAGLRQPVVGRPRHGPSFVRGPVRGHGPGDLTRPAAAPRRPASQLRDSAGPLPDFTGFPWRPEVRGQRAVYTATGRDRQCAYAQPPTLNTSRQPVTATSTAAPTTSPVTPPNRRTQRTTTTAAMAHPSATANTARRASSSMVHPAPAQTNSTTAAAPPAASRGTVEATAAPRPSARAGDTPRTHTNGSIARPASTATPTASGPRSASKQAATVNTCASTTTTRITVPAGPTSPRRNTSRARTRR